MLIESSNRYSLGPGRLDVDLCASEAWKNERFPPVDQVAPIELRGDVDGELNTDATPSMSALYPGVGGGEIAAKRK